MFKFSVVKSGVIALGLALAVSVGAFGITGLGLMTASGKALWLALFVSLIVWCALFLYHIVSDFGGFDVISDNLSRLVKDDFTAFLLMSWLFTGLLQGIAGFGVPAVIAAPLLIKRGFPPVKSLCAVLIGHCWAITFGSMASGFYVIHNLTGIPETELAFPMWTFNSITILLTGICVCFVYGGVKSVVKGLPKVIPAWAVMTAVQFAILHLEIFSLATLMTALVGLCTMFGLYKLRFGKSGESEMVGKSVGLTHPIRDNSKTRPTLLQATLPYILIMVLLLSFQFIPPEIRNKVAISPSFPAVTTSKGYETAAESGFNPIKLFVHPAFALALSALTACIIFKKAKIWDSSVFKTSASKTVKKGVPATLALLAFGHMSLIMMDSGMMFRLAKSVADLTGKFYPLAAPFIGVLGSFMTGNNTNSNVMFGRLQQTVAAELGLSEAVMASVQSISGGLGCAIASTLVYMAALATRQPENVPAVLRKLIPLVLIIAAVMGSLNYVINR